MGGARREKLDAVRLDERSRVLGTAVLGDHPAAQFDSGGISG